MSAYSIATRGLAGRKVPQGVMTPMGALLFAASEPGAWYDQSDMSPLWQDSAGTVPVTAVEQPVGRILDKSGRGNHATQATTTKRPIYSRRVNVYVSTENLSSVWTLTGATVTASGTSPTGSAAWLMSDSAVTSSHVAGQAVTVTNARHLLRLLAKPEGGRYVYLQVGNGADRGNAVFDLQTATVTASSSFGAGAISFSISPLTDGWLLLSASAVGDAGIRSFSFGISSGPAVGSSGFLGNDTRTILFAEPSLTLATDAHIPYQRVKTSVDYDADIAKFPAFRRLDGVDDSLACATGGGGSAGFFFSSVISPRGSAGTNRTLFSDAGTNTGYIVRLNTSNQLELSVGNGAARTSIATAGTLDVGASDVVQAWDDGVNLNVKTGSGPTASIARPVVSAGTAGYTLYQDNGASTGYFNGRSYGEIYRKDSGLTQSQREAVAVFQRQKARIA